LKNIIEPDKPHMKTEHKRIACCIHKATNTNSEHIVVSVLPMQQWLHERASI